MSGTEEGVVNLGVFFAIVGAMFGAVFASYFAVVGERGWKGSAEGRSHCVCGRQLAWWENVPVVSWLALRGKCRTCKSPIPVVYVLTEAGNMLWAGAVGYIFGWVCIPAAVLGGLVVAYIVRGRRLAQATEQRAQKTEQVDGSDNLKEDS